jgi:hypothetical protein
MNQRTKTEELRKLNKEKIALAEIIKQSENLIKLCEEHDRLEILRLSVKYELTYLRYSLAKINKSIRE